MPFLRAWVPAVIELRVRVRNVVELAQLVGWERQLDPELDRPFAIDADAGAEVPAGLRT
jgi:hypothetical protein